MPVALPLAALALVIVVAGCSAAPSGPGASGTPAATPAPSQGKASVVPVIVTTQQVVGPNRFMFSFLDAAKNVPAAAPDRTASVAFVPPGSSTATDPEPGTFVWAIEDERGVYILKADFASAGEWTAVFITQAPGGPEERIAMRFDVAQDGAAVAVGEAAKPTTNPVAADVDGKLDRISTDTNAAPGFYTTTVAEAIAANLPFVLVFTTPAFCQTAQCGPTMDRVKTVADAYPDLTFIHVEPYKLQYTEGRLQPVLGTSGGLQPVQAVLDWGILTEPWIYVVGADGLVSASLEGIFAEQELRDALDAVAA